MKSVSGVLAALGFALLFATCPAVYTALYPFESITGAGTFFVAAIVGLGVVALILCVRMRGFAPRLSAVVGVYLIGIVGFDACCAGVLPELLVLIAGFLLGSALPLLLLAWANALCTSDLSRNMVGVGLLCGAGAGLSWLMGSLEGATLIVLHVLLSAGSVVLLLVSERMRAGESGGEEPAGVVCASENRDASAGEAFARMMSVAFVPLAGFVISGLFSSMSALHEYSRLVVFGLDGEIAGFVLAAAIILLIGAARAKAPMLTLLYQLVIPICIVLMLLFVAIRQGTVAYQATSLFVMTLIPFLSILAIAICCTLAGTGEFEPRLALGPLLVAYALAHVAGLPLQSIAEQYGEEIPQAVMAVCLAALLIYQLVAAWRSSSAPATEATHDAAIDFQAACDRVCSRKDLSRREAEIFTYLARGYSPAYVAGALTLSESTVRTHVKNIYRKLGVNSREDILDLMNDEIFASGKEARV